jgi:hypothetical protein
MSTYVERIAEQLNLRCAALGRVKKENTVCTKSYEYRVASTGAVKKPHKATRRFNHRAAGSGSVKKIHFAFETKNSRVASTGAVEKLRRAEIVKNSRAASSGAVEKVHYAKIRNLRVASSGSVRETYLPAIEESVEDPGIVCDAHAANRKRDVEINDDAILVRGGRGKDDAVNFRVRRNRDIGRIRKAKRRNICWPIGNSIWRPIGSRIPVA